jgi:hypothetical protein
VIPFSNLIPANMCGLDSGPWTSPGIVGAEEGTTSCARKPFAIATQKFTRKPKLPAVPVVYRQSVRAALVDAKIRAIKKREVCFAAASRHHTMHALNQSASRKASYGCVE